MKIIKAITLSAILGLLIGCTPQTPDETKARGERQISFYTKYIKDNSIEVCIRGMSYIYFQNGNASQAIALLDPQTSRVIPCKESTQ